MLQEEVLQVAKVPGQCVESSFCAIATVRTTHTARKHARTSTANHWHSSTSPTTAVAMQSMFVTKVDEAVVVMAVEVAVGAARQPLVIASAPCSGTRNTAWTVSPHWIATRSAAAMQRMMCVWPWVALR